VGSVGAGVAPGIDGLARRKRDGEDGDQPSTTSWWVVVVIVLLFSIQGGGMWRRYQGGV
jgi:hypothetical protein